MYDIPELEKKWRKYKRNQIKKPLIYTAIVAVLLGGITILAVTYINKSSKLPVQAAAKSSTVQQQQPQQQAVQVKKDEPAMEIKKISSVSQQQANDNNGIDLSKAEIVKPNVPDDEIRVIGFDSDKEKKKIKKKYEDILIPKQSAKDIQEKEEMAQLEEEFKNTQDPQTSLKLARYYYKIGNYKKAEDWAVATNNIDGDIEESWLIFAKARAKQGFRTDAIKVLQSYYDETKSEKAHNLLVKLRKGLKY